MELTKLTKLIEDAWGEDIDECAGYARIILKHVKPELHEEVVKRDLFFNRYNGVWDYDDLAQTIVSDEWKDDAEAYLQQVQQAINNNNAESFLRKDGWCLDEEAAVAIGLDSHVLKEEAIA